MTGGQITKWQIRQVSLYPKNCY